MRDADPEGGNEPLREAERVAGRVLPPPSGHPRFPLMDPMRAVAAVSVMLVHVAILTGGFEPWYKAVLAHLDIGVPFFFLLSGFLLYRPMLASRLLRLPAQRLRDYSRNRFFRVIPAYWAVLTITAIVPGMYGAFTGNWWVYYGLLMNYPIYTPDGECATNLFRCGVPPVWTLAMEVAFYIVLPFFAFGMIRLRKIAARISWFRLELGVLLALALISVWIQGTQSYSDLHTWLFFSPLGRAWWFGLGMAMAAVSVRIQETGKDPELVSLIRRYPGSIWTIALALYLLSTYLIFPNGPALAAPLGNLDSYLGQYVLFGLIAALALAPAAFPGNGSGVPSRLLGHPWLIYLGLISYGIFLWHYPVMIGLGDLGAIDLIPGARFPSLALTTFALTVIMATASFYLLERPLMRWSRSLAGRRNR